MAVKYYKRPLKYVISFQTLLCMHMVVKAHTTTKDKVNTIIRTPSLA